MEPMRAALDLKVAEMDLPRSISFPSQQLDDR